MFGLVIGVIAVLGLLAVQAAANSRILRRLASFDPAGGPTVAVLIPARNEAARVGAAVSAWLAQSYDRFSLVVYDDDSGDDTSAAALRGAGADPRFRLLEGGALPPGWRGKPYACHRLRQAAGAEILVFADADVVPAPDALRLTVGALAATGADVVSALPRHESPSLAIRALLGLQGWAILALVPWWLSGERGPWRGALNGQFVAIRAGAYDAAGGYEAVRGSLAEDAALGRRLAALGLRVAYLDGAGVLTCRPYSTPVEAWHANVRNLAAVLGSPRWALAGAAALAALHAGPVVALVAGAGIVPGWPWTPLAAIAVGLVPRRLADRRAGHGWASTLLHPLAVTALAAMMVESWRRAEAGADVEWRGRRYRAGDGGAGLTDGRRSGRGSAGGAAA